MSARVRIADFNEYKSFINDTYTRIDEFDKLEVKVHGKANWDEVALIKSFGESTRHDLTINMHDLNELETTYVEFKAQELMKFADMQEYLNALK